MSMTLALDRPACESEQRPYAGCAAVLATMHGKEAAIAPPLLRRVGLKVSVPTGIDTDRLGTFSGEVERPGTIVEAAVAKARMAMAATGASLGIASEGTFGPHPDLFFVPAGIELMVLVDDERDIVISEYHIDEKTNFAHVSVAPGADVGDFLRRVGFPAHALIVRPNAGDLEYRAIEKGLVDRVLLREAIARCAAHSGDGLARIETDMRAHFNPTRMKSIRRLAAKFAARLATLCPGCGGPGFGLVDSVAGLPCSDCGAPTILIKHQVVGCASCSYAQERSRGDGRESAEPRYCPWCNP